MSALACATGWLHTQKYLKVKFISSAHLHAFVEFDERHFREQCDTARLRGVEFLWLFGTLGSLGSGTRKCERKHAGRKINDMLRRNRKRRRWSYGAACKMRAQTMRAEILSNDPTQLESAKINQSCDREGCVKRESVTSAIIALICMISSRFCKRLASFSAATFFTFSSLSFLAATTLLWVRHTMQQDDWTDKAK